MTESELQLLEVAVECEGKTYFAPLTTAGQVTCPGRRGSHAVHETSGVELLLDFSALPLAADE